jgi:hypothetical protein
MENPTSDQLKESYDHKATDPVVSDSDAKDFRKLGYTDKQIAHIRDQLRKAGFAQ